mmetsp:Transcript_24232/g.69041  ORF Transcript_24232/g.69041 Transcript_24232/m.69041 type:complete len:219 (-) Transcript_24232:409-1065(-)
MPWRGRCATAWCGGPWRMAPALTRRPTPVSIAAPPSTRSRPWSTHSTRTCARSRAAPRRPRAPWPQPVGQRRRARTNPSAATSTTATRNRRTRAASSPVAASSSRSASPTMAASTTSQGGRRIGGSPLVARRTARPTRRPATWPAHGSCSPSCGMVSTSTVASSSAENPSRATTTRSLGWGGWTPVRSATGCRSVRGASPRPIATQVGYAELRPHVPA